MTDSQYPPDTVCGLIRGGYLPASATLDPRSGQPCWAFAEIAELLGVAEAGLVETLLAKRGRPGLEYLDYKGETVAW